MLAIVTFFLLVSFAHLNPACYPVYAAASHVATSRNTPFTSSLARSIGIGGGYLLASGGSQRCNQVVSADHLRN